MLKDDALTEIINFEPYHLFICQLVAWKKTPMYGSSHQFSITLYQLHINLCMAIFFNN